MIYARTALLIVSEDPIELGAVEEELRQAFPGRIAAIAAWTDTDEGQLLHCICLGLSATGSSSH